MGFRFRRTIRVLPGVRLNLSKSGVSTSFGPRGLTVTTGHGRTRTTVGVPGTGVSYTSSKAATRSARSRQVASSTSAAARAPAMSKDDRRLVEALQAKDLRAIDAVARSKSPNALAAATLAGIIAMDHAPDWSRQMLQWVFASGRDPALEPFVVRWLHDVTIPVEITEGCTIEEPISRNLIGLLLAEWAQDDGDLAAAIDIVEQLEPISTAALSLAELYAAAGRWDDVIELTDGVTNTDDVTALLCVYRAEALRAQGHREAARIACNEALRSRSRSPEIRFRALLVRAMTSLDEGKPGMARRDLERIRAEDASYPGFTDALARLGHERPPGRSSAQR